MQTDVCKAQLGGGVVFSVYGKFFLESESRRLSFDGVGFEAVENHLHAVFHDSLRQLGFGCAGIKDRQGKNQTGSFFHSTNLHF